MTTLTKPARALLSLLFLLHVFCCVSAYQLHEESCGPYKDRVTKAVKEALEMTKYAEKRAATNAKFPRKGTLLQDLLGAGDENDAFVLGRVSGKTSTPILFLASCRLTSIGPFDIANLDSQLQTGIEYDQ